MALKVNNDPVYSTDDVRYNGSPVNAIMFSGNQSSIIVWRRSSGTNWTFKYMQAGYEGFSSQEVKGLVYFDQLDEWQEKIAESRSLPFLSTNRGEVLSLDTKATFISVRPSSHGTIEGTRYLGLGIGTNTSNVPTLTGDNANICWGANKSYTISVNELKNKVLYITVLEQGETYPDACSFTAVAGKKVILNSVTKSRTANSASTNMTQWQNGGPCFRTERIAVKFTVPSGYEPSYSGGTLYSKSGSNPYTYTFLISNVKDYNVTISASQIQLKTPSFHVIQEPSTTVDNEILYDITIVTDTDAIGGTLHYRFCGGHEDISSKSWRTKSISTQRNGFGNYSYTTGLKVEAYVTKTGYRQSSTASEEYNVDSGTEETTE